MGYIYFRVNGSRYQKYLFPKDLHEANPIFYAMHEYDRLYDSPPYDSCSRRGRSPYIDVTVPEDLLKLLVHDYCADASPGQFSNTAGALALALAFTHLDERDMVIRKAIEDDMHPSDFTAVFSKAYERRSVKLLSHLARASLRHNPALFNYLPTPQANLLTAFHHRMKVTFASRLGDHFPVRRLDGFRRLLVGPRRPGDACTCTAMMLPGMQETRPVKSWVALYVHTTINHLKRYPSLKAPWADEALGNARMDAEMYCKACLRENFTSTIGPVRLDHLSEFSKFVSTYVVALEVIADEEWAKMVRSAGPARY